MHIATVKTPVQWSHDILVKKGDYFLEDHNAAEFLWASRGLGTVSLTSATWNPPQEITNRLLITRVGGFGDLLWLNAIYEKLKESNPALHIAHCCFPRYAQVLQGYVDEVIPYPLNIEDTQDTTFYWLENFIEGKPCIYPEHPCDRMAQVFNLPALPKKSAYQITQQETEDAQVLWPRTDTKRICIQSQSSTGNKTYPHFRELLIQCWKKGWEIVIVGDPRHPEQEPKNIFDCSTRQMGIRESIAMAATCDVFICSDSVFVHVAEALDIPCVGLFGPFEGKAYLQGKGWVLQGRKECSPCHWHPRGQAFPPGQPCATSGRCEALALIEPEEIISKAQKFL
jgi:ADP-heptose:LPS heptosyltransferase